MNSIERRNEQIANREQLSGLIKIREAELPTLPNPIKPAAQAFLKALREEEVKLMLAVHASWEMQEEKL